tara:strand:+ start:1466 stop:1693 length:228 start_codon:yes stop_codon:yes gene_type:complete
MKRSLIVLIIIFFSGCVATTKWFRIYNEDIEYYEYQDSLNSIIILTDNELDSIILSDKGIEWFESHRLKAIILKK